MIDSEFGESISQHSIDSIRNLAESSYYEEISFNPRSRVISFVNEKTKVRVNVYYTTGTVGSCVDHPASGKIQLFRRNVSMDKLERIFENPQVHAGLAYHFRQPSLTEKEELERAVQSLKSKLVMYKEMLAETARREEEEERQRQLESERVAEENRQRKLERQRKLIDEIAQQVEFQLKQKQEKRQKTLAPKMELRGPNFQSYLSGSITHDARHHLNKNLRSLALCDHGYIFLYDSGSWASSGIPDVLLRRLSGRSSHHSPPVFVALSPSNRHYYYIQFENGTTWYKGPEDFENCIAQNNCIRSVAFGINDTWVVLFEDGHKSWSPNLGGLGTYLFHTTDDISFLTMNDKFYWVATLKDGTISRSKLSSGLENRIKVLEREGSKIRSIILGPNNNYVIRYS